MSNSSNPTSVLVIINETKKFPKKVPEKKAIYYIFLYNYFFPLTFSLILDKIVVMEESDFSFSVLLCHSWFIIIIWKWTCLALALICKLLNISSFYLIYQISGSQLMVGGGPQNKTKTNLTTHIILNFTVCRSKLNTYWSR